VASNPVLRGFEKTGRPGLGTHTAPGTPSAEQLNQWYQQPSAQQAYGQQAWAQPGFPPAPPQAPSRYLTLDDVITRSVMLFSTVLLAGGVAWFVLPDSAAAGVAMLAALLGFGLAMFISFTARANAVTTTIYAALEGLFLGAISEVFNKAFPGIAIQAITGTVMVAGGVLVVYKTGAVRVTPKLYKIVFAATLGAVGLMLVNMIAGFFTPGGLGLRDSSSPGLAIGFSLLCIVIGAMNLILDFDMIEQSVRRGVDEKYGWYLSFGLLVTIVWLYLEILRMLSYLREN
jgi:uncharacterized YccA/Bax inhibitor family protein